MEKTKQLRTPPRLPKWKAAVAKEVGCSLGELACYLKRQKAPRKKRARLLAEACLKRGIAISEQDWKESRTTGNSYFAFEL